MDKNRPPNVMRLGYRDLGKGGIHKHPIDYVDLSTFIKEKIAPDLTEHELLDRINLALDRIIEHFEEITGEEFTVEDVMEWL